MLAAEAANRESCDMSHKVLSCIALLVFLACLAMRASRPSEVVELRDESGRVRCRVGNLASAGDSWGVEVLDIDGKLRVRIGTVQGAAGLTLVGHGDLSQITLSADELGALLSLRGAGSAGVVFRAREKGSSLECTGGRAANPGRVHLASEAGVGHLSIATGHGGTGSRVVLEANGKESLVAAEGGGVLGARLLATSGVGALLSVGDPTGDLASGVLIQATREDGAALMVRHKGARVSLESLDATGCGLTVTNFAGEPVVKLGAGVSGERLEQVIDQAGRLINRK